MATSFRLPAPFTLESGHVIPSLQLAYTSHGRLNEERNNVVWIFHALTANSDPAEWWPGLVGEGRVFDPADYFIICVNMPGSCYGSTGPLDLNAETGTPYYHEFPLFTIRDMVRAYRQLKDSLGITRIHTGIGGSMGGQQLLEWAIEEPVLFERIVPIATNAVHSPWAIAFNATQRHAIEQDSTWPEQRDDAGIEGMKLARQIALLSYRNYQTYALGQSEDRSNKVTGFKSESYQVYQGEKLAKRFNAFSYYYLSRSMDSHDVGRNRASKEEALAVITAKALVISISSDVLFPPQEQALIAARISGAQYHSISSDFGHDGFLLEFEQISQAITRTFKQKEITIPAASGKEEATVN